MQILLLFLLLLYGCVITATAATGNSTVRQKTNSMYIFCTASLNWNAWGRGERWRKMESKMFFQDKHNATNLVRLKYSVCHSVPLFRNVFFHFISFCFIHSLILVSLLRIWACSRSFLLAFSIFSSRSFHVHFLAIDVLFAYICERFGLSHEVYKRILNSEH